MDTTLESTPASRTLVRGLRLLELVAEHPGGAKVSDLAVAAELDKGTTSRLLSALRDAGYVQQNADTKTYRLAGKVAGLAGAFYSSIDLRALARPHLENLRDQYNETVHLAIREHLHLVFIDQLEASNALRYVLAPGHRLPLHVTSMGRAILAAEPPDVAEALIAALQADPTHDGLVSDLADLRASVSAARERGWATAERDDGVARAGAAILDATGTPFAALSVSGPDARMRPHLEEIGTAVAEAARQIGLVAAR
jgi:IclR family acetate operon transcriptional repressor